MVLVDIGQRLSALSPRTKLAVMVGADALFLAAPGMSLASDPSFRM